MPSREGGASLDALREAARTRVADTSLRQAAREIGWSHPALRDFLNGSTPRGASVAKLRDWYERATNEVLRLRQEVAELRKRLAACERKLGKA